jgi:hypothetical protein
MANTNLTVSHMTNMAFAEALYRGAPISGCEVSNWYDLSANEDIWTFTFGDKNYLNNRKVMRTPEIWARAYDEDAKSNGLLFTIRLKNIAHLSAIEARKLIGDEVSSVLFNLQALRMAG